MRVWGGGKEAWGGGGEDIELKKVLSVFIRTVLTLMSMCSGKFMW